MEKVKILEVKESIFADNNAEADRIRAELERAGATATWTYRMRVSEADG